MADRATSSLERKGESNEEVFEIAEIMGGVMEVARAVQFGSHTIKGIDDSEGQDILDATCTKAAHVLRNTAQAIDPEKRHRTTDREKKKKKGHKKKQRSGRDGGRQEQNCLGTASRRRSSSTSPKRPPSKRSQPYWEEATR